MNKYVIALFALLAVTSSALAADVIDLKRGVKFPHKQHIEILNDCTKCHAGEPGKIADFGKDWAHKSCKGCHTEQKKGPTNCKGCHNQ